MAKRGLWFIEKAPRKKPKTFWLDQSTFAKLKAIQAIARDPDQIIAEIRNAIVERIEKLYEERPEKETPK